MLISKRLKLRYQSLKGSLNLSVFDLDHTLLKKNSSVEFCKYLYKKKKLSFFSVLLSLLYYIRHSYLSLSLEDLHRKTFNKLLYKMRLEDLEKEASLFAQRYLDDLIYGPAFKKLKSAQELGHFTMILSSSPGFLVRVLAEKLQVNAWKASEYQIDESGRLSKISCILQGEGKAMVVQDTAKRLSISKKDITAYSDSHLDFPFLMSAGTSVLVNPTNRLKALSKELGWLTI